MGAWSYVQPRIATALRKLNGAEPHAGAQAAAAAVRTATAPQAAAAAAAATHNRRFSFGTRIGTSDIDSDKGCLVQVGNGIELQAVGFQFEPYRWRPCGVTWDSSRTVVVIKLRRTSALRSRIETRMGARMPATRLSGAQRNAAHANSRLRAAPQPASRPSRRTGNGGTRRRRHFI